MSDLIEFTGTDGCAASTKELATVMLIGAKSFATSYCRPLESAGAMVSALAPFSSV